MLRQGRFIELPAVSDGIYRSQVFPGLWLDEKALLAGDSRQVLDRLQQGIRSPAHERFVAELAARKKT